MGIEENWWKIRGKGLFYNKAMKQSTRSVIGSLQ